MSTPLIPTRSDIQPHIEGEAEQLAHWLRPPFDLSIEERIGAETLIEQEGNLAVLEGQRFKNRTGWIQGCRYLKLDQHGQPIAVLNLTHQKNGRTLTTIVSNIFVDPQYRRQGLADGLIRRALKDYPKLVADHSMTLAGAALLGYTTPSIMPLKRAKP